MATAIPHALAKSFSWQSPDGKQKGTFRGNPGKFRFAYKEGEKRFAVRDNPVKWGEKGKPTYAGNLFVGFSVGNKPTYTMDDLVTLVKKVRKRQVNHPDSSFVYQKGVYTHESDGTVVTENGAQVILLNVYPMQKSFIIFRRHIIRLAEIICEEMKQETVIVRIDKNGITEETIGVIA